MKFIILLLLLVFTTNILTTTSENSCSGGFDVYFVLDRSTSVSKFNFQNQTVEFVRNIIQHLVSPKLRVSLVVFSNEAELVLPITGKRTSITAGIEKLKNIEPGGTTYLLSSIEKVEKQIEEKGTNTANVLIILTDGDLYDEPQTVQKTDKLRILFGTSVFAVGVEGYKLQQLENLANKPSRDYVFTATNYQALQIISEKIISKACTEITYVQPEDVCVGESRDITLHGKGFTGTYDQSKIKCSFQINATFTYYTEGYDVSGNQLKCRFPLVHKPISNIDVKISLNGQTFVSSDQKINVRICTKKSYGSIILLILVIMVLLTTLGLWWFWWLLPCVNNPPLKASPLIDPLENETDAPIFKKKKWDTVDTSYYGGGGVGGMKPIRVQWGNKGATEAGNKLTKTPDAKVISSFDEGTDTTDTSTLKKTQKTPSLFARIKVHLISLYERLRHLRPRKGGSSRLYSTKLDR